MHEVLYNAVGAEEMELRGGIVLLATENAEGIYMLSSSITMTIPTTMMILTYSNVQFISS